jgi:trk system potassium uptake protein TrkA
MLTYEYIIIVGYGRLGSLLANRLSSQGSSVVVIDKKETAFDKLSLEFSGFKIVGDAAELDVLRQAKIDKADCLLAVTNQDNLNLMVAQVARNIFHVPKVMARVFDPAREAVYRQFGIETISPTKLSADAFLNALQEPVEVKQHEHLARWRR